jgi:hypothetical protein
MYISARQIERDIKIYKHKNVEDAIKETTQTLLDQLIDYVYFAPIQLNTNHITINQIFQSEDESIITNAEKLKYLIDNIYEIIEKLDVDQSFSIGTYNDPAYEIKINKNNNKKIKVSAYSNLDDNNFWDEIIEWID